ncbi:hypothetical protein LCGC14_1266550 [marine sediment metagenome]|uniref:Uncharacterized protein n=1 Tax=marine sediment metagenome TaxID=412755 RepID=A0A0F9P2I3_9ZZZZ
MRRLILQMPYVLCDECDRSISPRLALTPDEIPEFRDTPRLVVCFPCGLRLLQLLRNGPGGP